MACWQLPTIRGIRGSWGQPGCWIAGWSDSGAVEAISSDPQTPDPRPQIPGSMVSFHRTPIAGCRAWNRSRIKIGSDRSDGSMERWNDRCAPILKAPSNAPLCTVSNLFGPQQLIKWSCLVDWFSILILLILFLRFWSAWIDTKKAVVELSPVIRLYRLVTPNSGQFEFLPVIFCLNRSWGKNIERGLSR